MLSKRTAIDTITGYYYQFDKSIIQLLSCENLMDEVTIEGIEDIDVNSGDTSSAIQCKYYAKSEYNHSLISKAVRLMLQHYKQNIDKTMELKYKIFGYYKSGHEKLVQPITSNFLKEKFLTYTKNSIKHELHVDLNLTDTQLEEFISRLEIDINATDFFTQENRIIIMLKDLFNCREFEAEYYFYNNALREIRRLATLQNINDRRITKKNFIANINKKSNLFDIWYLEHRGVTEYAKMIKKNYFTTLNISPYERFFLFECDDRISEQEVKSLILNISKKWSRLSKKDPSPFCPYIYLHGYTKSFITSIKKCIHDDDIFFIDGYDFLDSHFSCKSILRKPNAYNGIQFKFITNLDELDITIKEAKGTLKIYEFYLDLPFYEIEKHQIDYIKIQNTNDINKMI